MERQTQPPPEPKIIAVIDREWPDLRRRFVAVALKRTQNLAVAEDLVHDTYKSIRSGSRCWDPEKDTDFTAFVASVLLSHIDHWRKNAFNRRRDRNYDVHDAGADEPDLSDGLRKPKPAAARLGPSPEEMANMREEIEQAFTIAFDPYGVECALLALFKRGIHDPFEQAHALGIPVDEVRKTIQRVDRIIRNTLSKQRKIP